MTTTELPPLPNPPLEYRHEGCTYIDRESFLEWHDQHSARERILIARVAANDDALSWIGELMAVMHADGGHYLAKHGMEKAIGDAMDKYHAMHSRVAELEKDLADCFRLTGADPDSNEDWRLARWAVKEVAAMRTDLDLAEARVAELEAGRERAWVEYATQGTVAARGAK